MAATNPSPRESVPADDQSSAGVGMRHLTVVPTNFEPETADRDDEH
ncbi:hypothetical protein [Natrialba taiwanensis]|uniref:Hydrolase n=1 Tax=Natrialba taiwanensis DSM 12281 TaxID=1230458 RepID=M0A0K5_9EURY|nr:hypothetical protein [Natrialba taiwanensis]ELY90903.1 hydrolase [Natrialba taiwanensis DSM 12281]